MTPFTNADDAAVAIEELLGLPEESVATEGQTRVSLTLSQASALVDLARGHHGD